MHRKDSCGHVPRILILMVHTSPSLGTFDDAQHGRASALSCNAGHASTPAWCPTRRSPLLAAHARLGPASPRMLTSYTTPSTRLMSYLSPS